jgi:hypothetical protein
VIRYLAQGGGAAWPTLLGISATVVLSVLICIFMRNR